MWLIMDLLIRQQGHDKYTPWKLKHAGVSTHLCDLFLESERESSASIGKGPCSVGDVLQPLNDEGGWDIKREIPDDVKVWWICGAAHTHLSTMDLLHMTTIRALAIS